MGSNSSTQDKITIDQKLQFLQTKVIKLCSYHNKQSIRYCAIVGCQKCPYLCEDCIRQKIHPHQDGKHNFPQFLKQIVKLIQIKKNQQNQILKASIADISQDYTSLYKQEIKLMENLDILQRQTIRIFSQFRQRLQVSIDRLTKKMNKTYQIKTSSYINFYRNPNILACKLSSQQDDKFLLQLKAQLRSINRKNMVINEDEQFTQLKNLFANAKNQIRETLNITTTSNFVKKNTKSFSTINPVFKKTFVLPSSQCPNQMFLAGSNINITTLKQLYSAQTLSKQLRKTLSQPVGVLSSRRQGQQFIGLLNQSRLLTYDGKNINQISLNTRISCVNILKSKRKLYGLLGQQEGVFNIIDLQQVKSTFHYRCGDQPITFIEICETNSTIVCSGRKTPIYMFKYKSRFANIEDKTQLDFQFICQMNLSILPQGQLQLMRIHNNQLYLLGPYKNIVIFDLMLNTQIIRTEYSKKCGSFTNAQFLTVNQADYLLTVNQKEDYITLWYIDKFKRSIRTEQILNDKGGKPILSLICVKSQIWLIRDNLKNIDIFSV